jgi:hypothetical protein
MNSLYFNTGSFNTSIGRSALESNTTASDNTAVGYLAGTANTTGFRNVFMGRSAGVANTTGQQNTIIGSYAGTQLTTGSTNVGIGDSSCGGNSASAFTGSSNTVVGNGALEKITSGSYNLALGTSASKNATTGNGNVILGALNSSGTYSPLYDLTTGNDRVAIGTTSTTNAYVQVSWTVLSDARDKTNISDLNIGLDFVNKLHPVKYQFKKSREDETPHGNLRYGFLAQEVLELEGNQPVIIDNEDSEKLRYTGESLVPVLVKAIQELKAELDTVKAELAALKG